MLTMKRYFLAIGIGSPSGQTPPVTSIVRPVTKSASAEARKQITRAWSAGSATRRSGVRSISSACEACERLSQCGRMRSVRVTLGATALTRMSIAPCWRTTSATSASTSAGTRASTSRPSALPPSRRNAGTAWSSRSRLLSTAITVAPSRTMMSAVARPMPLAAAVISATWFVKRMACLRSGCLGRRLVGRPPLLDHREHFLGEQLEAALRHLVGRAAEAEGDVHLEVAQQLPPRLEPAQDLVGRAPRRGLHEAGDRALQPAALAGQVGLLLVGVVALHRLEVLAEELVVVEVALDELALVAARLVLQPGGVGAADAEFGQHDGGRLGAVILAVQGPAALDIGRAHLPRPVGEHHHVGAELGSRIDRILARGHRVDAAVEGMLRPRPDLGARLLVVLAPALHHAGPEGVDDHRRGLVEAAARFVHVLAEHGELAPGEAAAHAE